MAPVRVTELDAVFGGDSDCVPRESVGVGNVVEGVRVGNETLRLIDGVLVCGGVAESVAEIVGERLRLTVGTTVMLAVELDDVVCDVVCVAEKVSVSAVVFVSDNDAVALPPMPSRMNLLFRSVTYRSL